GHDGVFKSWFTNGNQFRIFTYANKNITGKFLEYYENGTLFKEQEYNEAGKENGKYIVYSDKRIPLLICNYKNGLPNGLSQTWYKNGNKESETNYTEGEKHGVYRKYHKNGKLQKEENYYFGKETGTWKEFDSLGILKSEKKFDKPPVKKPVAEEKDNNEINVMNVVAIEESSPYPPEKTGMDFMKNLKDINGLKISFYDKEPGFEKAEKKINKILLKKGPVELKLYYPNAFKAPEIFFNNNLLTEKDKKTLSEFFRNYVATSYKVSLNNLDALQATVYFELGAGS
ncbi:MAG: toxin-antitoxin system YwqK family antitoxin, partial [Bacteroidia bacterium]|nr:toxin-antitoxin system YwqK family antitoxin [Bacteroidia bacterium]